MSYYTDTGYLTRIAWRDGTLLYCRPCDAKVPHSADDKWLVCEQGHRQHPVTAIASGQVQE